jgi:formate hydrogenlyase transcriptional activator
VTFHQDRIDSYETTTSTAESFGLRESASDERLRFEQMLFNQSSRFVKIKADEVDREIELALKQILDFFQVDRAALLGMSGNGERVHITHAAYVKGIGQVSGDIDLASLYPWVYEKLVQGHPVRFAEAEEMPEAAELDKSNCTAMGILSFLNIPLFYGGRLDSIISLNSVRRKRSWPDEYIPRLRLLGEIFVNALVRKRKDQALRESEEQLRARLVEIEKLKHELVRENMLLRSESTLMFDHSGIIGESSALRKILSRAEQVARTESTVLITGETGTGKELLALEIHKLSSRKDRPMVTVNCSCLPPTLIESELFGREKGAYTGALTRMAGRFEVADGSTIFLDEIGELPLELQVKLLRVIEEGTFERLGSTRTIRGNVRLIAATNRDLSQAVRQGTFRQDLYYRLNVFPIVVPALRERAQDIPLLVWAFIRQFEKKMGKQIESIPKRSMDALQRYSWPGNIRELRNVVEHAMIVSTGNVLTVHLPAASGNGDGDGNLESAERKHILAVLERSGWRVSGEGGAARLLGVKRTTLQSKMKKLGLIRPAS